MSSGKSSSNPKEHLNHPQEQSHPHQHGGGTHPHSGWLDTRTELYFSIAAGLLLVAGFLIRKMLPDAPVGLALALFIGTYIFGGFFAIRETIRSLGRGKFEIDFLMIVAAAGAAALDKWAEGGLLLFLFSLGHSLEHMAMEKARKSIEALAGLAPRVATVKRDGRQQEIPIEQLRVGDLVIVKPNSKIPADGVVVAGNSSVNQAPITGESIPVDKSPVDDPDAPIRDDKAVNANHKVFAGSINGASVLEIRTLKEAKDSTLARVVKMVREAEQQQSPTQQFTKKIERYYVPAVLILVVLLMFAFLVVNEKFADSFYRAMAVLVAASPCALAISTPSAVLSGVARAARQGVLVKGGRPLEDLGVLTAIAFDKTGTLTEGKPKLTHAIAFDGVSETELLEIAVAVERLSDHPLAAAIVKGALEKLGNGQVGEARDLRAVAGKGIEAFYKDHQITIGNAELFMNDKTAGIPNDVEQQLVALQQQGNTAMVVRRNDVFIGIVAVMDTPRKEAATVLNELKAMGIRKMVMLTGDNQRVADAIAKEVGLTDARGDLLPEEKVAAISELRRQENGLAMVGDGVNDAPAMAKSTVGIAMGAAGSDVALETADIALMADRLDNLPFAIALSRKSKRIIHQNLFISMGMVAILVPLTILGIANIGPAVAAHEGSTLLVVLNALRLLAK